MSVSSQTSLPVDRSAHSSSLQVLFHVGTLGGLTDGQLLERFLSGGRAVAEAAFTLLVQRHGPMVLSVCQGVLGNRHDAEDVFQATFLVLARQAGSIRREDAVASWLYGVARRLSLRSRRRAAQRRANSSRDAWPPCELVEPAATAAPGTPGRNCMKNWIGCRSRSARPWSSAISRAIRTTRPPRCCTVRSGRSRAGCRGDGSGSAAGWSAGAWGTALPLSAWTTRRTRFAPGVPQTPHAEGRRGGVIRSRWRIDPRARTRRGERAGGSELRRHLFARILTVAGTLSVAALVVAGAGMLSGWAAGARPWRSPKRQHSPSPKANTGPVHVRVVDGQGKGCQGSRWK